MGRIAAALAILLLCVPSARADETKEDLEALRGQIGQPGPAWQPVAGQPAPEFKFAVANALTAIEKDKVQQYHEKRAARLDQRVARLSERLNLNPYQIAEMTTVLSGRDQREQDLIAMWQRGVDDEVLGQTKRSNAEQFETEIQRVLTPEQLETFREIGSEGGGKD